MIHRAFKAVLHPSRTITLSLSLFQSGRHQDLAVFHTYTQRNHPRRGARSVLRPEAAGAAGGLWLRFG